MAAHSSLLPIYKAPGGLPQAPGRAAELSAEAGSNGRERASANLQRPPRPRCEKRSPTQADHLQKGTDDVPLTTSAFNLPDHLTPKADATLIAG